MEKQKRVKMLDINCNKCSCQLNSWDARLSKVLAYKTPVCEKCIAEEYDMDVDDLRENGKLFWHDSLSRTMR